MKGVAMELQDAAFPLVTKIVSTTDYQTAFQDCDSEFYHQALFYSLPVTHCELCHTCD